MKIFALRNWQPEAAAMMNRIAVCVVVVVGVDVAVAVAVALADAPRCGMRQCFRGNSKFFRA